MERISNIRGIRKATWCIAALLLLCVCCALVSPQSAYANVRGSDVVCGQTVSSRLLATSSCPDITADYALLADANGNVYFSRNPDAQVQIASVTKIMTAVVALEYASPDTTITVSSNAATIGGSSMGLKAGDTMTLSTAFDGLMLPSGNDAAIAIAESLGASMLKDAGKDASDLSACQAEFVSRMNQEASILGMDGALYATPTGLDDGLTSSQLHCSANNLLILVEHAMKNETFRNIVKQKTATVTVTNGNTKRKVKLTNVDEMIGSFNGACGVKTGYTNAAGACLVSAVNRGDGDMYAIVLHSSTEAQRFTDAENLFNWYYNNLADYKLANASDNVDATINGNSQSYPVMANVALGAWMDKTVKATIANPSQTTKIFKLAGNVTESASYDVPSGSVNVGDKVGTLTFYQQNRQIAQVDLVAAESVPAPSIPEAVGIWFQRIFNGLGSDGDTAQSTLTNTTPAVLDKQAAA